MKTFKNPEYQIRKAHEDAINSLIPIAEIEADRKIKRLKSPFRSMKGKDESVFNYSYWTQYFHQAMNRMTKEEGLRC